MLPLMCGFEAVRMEGSGRSTYPDGGVPAMQGEERPSLAVEFLVPSSSPEWGARPHSAQAQRTGEPIRVSKVCAHGGGGGVCALHWRCTARRRAIYRSVSREGDCGSKNSGTRTGERASDSTGAWGSFWHSMSKGVAHKRHRPCRKMNAGSAMHHVCAPARGGANTQRSAKARGTPGKRQPLGLGPMYIGVQ